MSFALKVFASLVIVAAVAGLSPVIIIPGDGGNQLEARLDKEGVAEDRLIDSPPFVTSLVFASNTMRTYGDCPLRRDWYRLWLDVWELARSLKCWADNIQLHFDPISRKNQNAPGVQTRVPGWGETSSVEYLDPSWSAWVLKDVGNYFHTMVSKMVDSWGFVRGQSVRAAPYDFRFAPPSQGSYFARLKSLIEETRRANSNSPVTLISHSMGGLFALHFLNQMTDEWKREHIKRFVPIGTPWAGTTIAFNIFAAGYDLGISAVDPKIIRAEQRSYETGAELLPHPSLWHPKDSVFLSTPKRNFTSQDYGQFFDALKFPVGKINHDNVVHLTDNLTFPGVNVLCIYSKGVETMAELIYDDDDNFVNGEQPKRRRFGDGDGSVNLESLKLCENWKGSETVISDETSLDKDLRFSVTVKVFEGINHADTIKDARVLEYLKHFIE